MKFLFATDTHATGKGPSSRTDSYPLAVKRKLMELAQAAKLNKVEAVFHGGDLFDKPVVSLQLTGEIADIIRSSGVPWYVVPGNHDLFGYNINSLPQTSLGLLEKAGVITVLDRRHGPVEFQDQTSGYDPVISFEGQEYHKDIDHRDPAFDYYVTSSADYKILIPHSMLLDKEYFPDVPYTKVEDAAKNTEADMILVGHYHDGYGLYQGKNRLGNPISIRNPGSMLRDEASKGNLTRKPKYLLLEWDNVHDTMAISDCPFKTAQEGSKIFDRSHITAKAQKDKYLMNFEQKLSDVKLDAVDVRTVLDKIAKESKLTGDSTHNESHKRLTDAEQILTDVGQSLSGYTEKLKNIHITEIKIKGFQSHEDTTIKLNGGLNAIVGPSDSGKSSIIRALRFALFNEPKGSDFIRQSSSSVECSVYFSDGTSITRTRTKSSAGSYVVRDVGGTETELKGFTHNVPIDIANTHQMPKIQLTKDKEASLNLGMQLEGPFLIGESPGTRAQIIGQLTGVELVDHALKELNKDILGNTREVKSKRETIANIDTQLDGFQDLDNMKNKIDVISKLINRVELIENLKADLEDIKKQWTQAESEITMTENLLSCIPDTKTLNPKIERLENLQKEYAILEDIHSDMLKVTSDIETAERILLALPKDMDTRVTELEKISAEYSELTGLSKGIQVANNSEKYYLETLSLLPQVDTDRLDSLARNLKDLETLQELATSIRENRIELVELRKEMRQAALNEQQANAEYQQTLEELGTCPTCGQTI